MNSIQIYRGESRQPLCSLPLDDSFVLSAKQMGEETLRCSITVSEPLPLQVGDFTEWGGTTYTLFDQPDYKHSEAAYSYTLVLYAPYYRLTHILHKDEGSLTFPLDGNLDQHLKALMISVAAEIPGYSYSLDPEAATPEFQHLEFDTTTCLDALSLICEAFGVEWNIRGHHLRVGKHIGTKLPDTFEYGQGNGLYSLDKVGVSNRTVATRLYGRGSKENLPPGYRAQTLLFDNAGKDYLEKNTEKYGVREEVITFDDIYPHLVDARLTAVTPPADIPAATGWTVTTNLPVSCPGYEMLKDQEARIKFTTGPLMGEGFAITAYDPSTGILSFNISEDNGYKLPSVTRQPTVGDQFVLLGILMPQSLVDAAEAELKKKTQEELDKRCEKSYAYRLDIDPRYVRKHTIQVAVGDSIQVRENPGSTAVAIRVTELSYPLATPERLSLTLSDEILYTSFSEKVTDDIKDVTDQVETVHSEAFRFTRRVWRDTLQSMEMLRKGLKDYTDSIRPIAVNTMQLLVGDESLQFRFVVSRENLTPLNPVRYDTAARQLIIQAATLQHLTLNDRDLTSKRPDFHGLFWAMPTFNSPAFENAHHDLSYYLYAKVPKEGSAGEYLLVEEPIEIDQISGFYHLWVGILNSEIDGQRSYTDLYGFTEITPGRVTADRLVSSDGFNYLDLRDNKFHIGNATSSLDWNATRAETLTIRNASMEIVKGDKNMVHIDGETGAGHFAAGAVQWDAAGNFKATSGTFNDVIVNGSVRNTFQGGEYIFNSTGSGSSTSTRLGLHDNNNIVIPGIDPQNPIIFTVPFSAADAGTDVLAPNFSGFRGTIVNADFQGQTSVGLIVANAPAGKYFYENGITYSQLKIAPHEGVEIMGIGETDDLTGWIVLNRFHVGLKQGTGCTPFGSVLCAGRIDRNGDMISSWGHVGCTSRQNQDNIPGFYRITHNLGHMHYSTLLTPYNANMYGAYNIYPVVFAEHGEYVQLAFLHTTKIVDAQNFESACVPTDFNFCIVGEY